MLHMLFLCVNMCDALIHRNAATLYISHLQPLSLCDYANILAQSTISPLALLFANRCNIITQCMPIMMGLCKKDVTPLLTHWSCIFLALSHRYVLDFQTSWQCNVRTSLSLIKHVGNILHLFSLQLLTIQFSVHETSIIIIQSDMFWFEVNFI